MKNVFHHVLVFLLHHTCTQNAILQGQPTADRFESLLKKHVEENFPFVDKTQFIEEFIPPSKSSKGVIITRPPRWGKSMNLQMLDKFVSIDTDDEGNKKTKSNNELLFSEGEYETEKGERKKYLKLKISEHSDVMAHRGCYPTFYIDLSKVLLPFTNASSSMEKFIIQFSEYISHTLNTRYPYLKKYYHESSTQLIDCSKDRLKSYFDGTMNRVNFPYTIAVIAETLHKHFNKTPVYLLVDNYDSLFIRLFIKLGRRAKLFEQIFSSMVETFHLLFKRPYSSFIGKILLTGVFALDMGELSNSFPTYTISDEKYSEYYGFTDTEVERLLLHASLGQDKKNEMKLWYNGYLFGRLYNPFSVISCITTNGTIKSYWNGSINTELDDHVKNIIRKLVVRESILDLNEMKTLYCHTSPYINFFARFNNFPMLVNYGLVTTTAKCNTSDGMFYRIPNKEVKLIYERELEVVYAPTTTTKSSWEKFREIFKYLPN